MKPFAVFSLCLFIAISTGLSIASAAQHSPEVYKAQQALKAQGYDPGIPDGLWGKSTERAVKYFQVDNELPVTGKLDEQTKEKLGIVSTERGLKVYQPVGEKRLALVIGNSAYKASPLKNPVNDAKDMSNALKVLGFKVIEEIDADRKEMEDAIRQFGRQLRGGGVGLFYYAGHGIQTKGRNYLIPIGARIESASDSRYQAVDAGMVLGKMEDAENDLNIVVLDACRDNPFSRSFRTSSRGLARMDAPTGTFIVYATGPGSVASDGEGRNGIFTHHLLENMSEPGLKIEDVMKKVRTGVMEGTGNKQVPWQASSLTGDFYFASRTFDIQPESSSVDTAALPLPPSGGASFDDILKTAEEKKKAEGAWGRWQGEREREYNEVRRIDKDSYVNRKQRIDAWKRFSASVSTDNPHSAEDDDMRTYAKSRIKYWQRVKPPKKETPAPKIAAIDSKDQVIARDGHYIAYANGVVHDTRTRFLRPDLELIAGPDTDTTWDEAQKWVESLKTAGGGWRMPTAKELETLYQKGKGSRNMTPLLKTTGWYVWSGKARGSSSALSFGFFGGARTWLPRDLPIDRRAFAVRSRR
jgi:uncharacterized caspase-like protein